MGRNTGLTQSMAMSQARNRDTNLVTCNGNRFGTVLSGYVHVGAINSRNKKTFVAKYTTAVRRFREITWPATCSVTGYGSTSRITITTINLNNRACLTILGYRLLKVSDAQVKQFRGMWDVDVMLCDL